MRPEAEGRRYRIQCRESTDFVEEPSVLAPALGICGDISEADSWLIASCGKDGRRERNELRQLCHERLHERSERFCVPERLGSTWA